MQQQQIVIEAADPPGAGAPFVERPPLLKVGGEPGGPAAGKGRAGGRGHRAEEDQAVGFAPGDRQGIEPARGIGEAAPDVPGSVQERGGGGRGCAAVRLGQAPNLGGDHHIGAAQLPAQALCARAHRSRIDNRTRQEIV
jgi:hypothetical protein